MYKHPPTEVSRMPCLLVPRPNYRSNTYHLLIVSLRIHCHRFLRSEGNLCGTEEHPRITFVTSSRLKVCLKCSILLIITYLLKCSSDQESAGYCLFNTIFWGQWRSHMALQTLPVSATWCWVTTKWWSLHWYVIRSAVTVPIWMFRMQELEYIIY